MLTCSSSYGDPNKAFQTHDDVDELLVGLGGVAKTGLASRCLHNLYAHKYQLGFLSCIQVLTRGLILTSRSPYHDLGSDRLACHAAASQHDVPMHTTLLSLNDFG